MTQSPTKATYPRKMSGRDQRFHGDILKRFIKTFHYHRSCSGATRNLGLFRARVGRPCDWTPRRMTCRPSSRIAEEGEASAAAMHLAIDMSAAGTHQATSCLSLSAMRICAAASANGSWPSTPSTFSRSTIPRLRVDRSGCELHRRRSIPKRTCARSSTHLSP